MKLEHIVVLKLLRNFRIELQNCNATHSHRFVLWLQLSF